MVHTVYETGDIPALRRGGQEHLRCACLQVESHTFCGGKDTGTFQYQVYPQFPPGESAGILLLKDRHRAAIHNQLTGIRMYRSGIPAVGRVVSEQVGQGS
ncbi:hypothetical protein RZS08_49870, partial [Arthrospira platensis SPKY1]|nr:hypothetical protein [Arthrospira platensis SPKY1]